MTPAPAPALSLPTLNQATFDKFRALIYEKTGIHMRDGKQILVSNRLRRRVTLLHLASYEEYYALLTSGKRAEEEMPHFIDAVSTNETYFFREERHFSALSRVILPELFKTEKKVRIWSAGCSTGEEVYTLRIVADEAAREAGGADVQITGTDISTTVIGRAREGVYHERALRLVPAALRARCFVPASDGAFQVRPELRARVDFKVHNLFIDPPPADRINIIFCRNVMIYFDKKTQAALVDRIFARAIHPEGYLFIGHSESISGFSTRFRYAAILKAPIYRPRAVEPPAVNPSAEDTP